MNPLRIQSISPASVGVGPEDWILTLDSGIERIARHPPLGSTLDPFAIMGQPNPWGFFAFFLGVRR